MHGKGGDSVFDGSLERNTSEQGRCVVVLGQVVLYLDGVEGGDHEPCVETAKLGDEGWSEEKYRHRQKQPAIRHVVGKHLPQQPTAAIIKRLFHV